MQHFSAPLYETAVVDGGGERRAMLEIPLGGQRLSGEPLRRQIDDWTERGLLEPSAADALRELIDKPEWLDLRDMHFALLGAGARHYGVEVFEPETTNAVMAALLVHDLRQDECPANPSHPLRHPLELFMDRSVHGGLWRAGLQLRSVLEIAAVRGFMGGSRK